MKKYTDYALDMTCKLLAIDSPTGYTAKASAYVAEAFEELGMKVQMTNKGSVIVDFGGQDDNDGLLLEAHTDTLGAMVAEIKDNGQLRVMPLGGLYAPGAVSENCRIITRNGKIYDGTFQLCNGSAHVNSEVKTAVRTFDNTEVVIDEITSSIEETKALGIQTGDIVAFDTRTKVTESGYIKSRFLDDKLSVGALYGLARYISEQHITPARHVYAHITTFEEVGHGGCASVPEGVTEAISVDMGCVGDGLACTERQVSICAKDSHGPYHYDVVSKLIDAAIREGADYAIDIYPNYGSDVEATLSAGHDIRHGLIGPGVYVSHGYERSHIDGLMNTILVLKGYLGI